MKLTPQDIDRMENAQLDAEGRFGNLSLQSAQTARVPSAAPEPAERERARADQEED